MSGPRSTGESSRGDVNVGDPLYSRDYGRPMLNNSLRLVSANLRNGGADSAAFAELMSRLQPDVAAVQEITPRQARALAEVLPYGEIAPSQWFAGMGIALRRPGTVRSLRLGYRDAWVAEVAAGNGASGEVLNVHIRAPHLLPIRRTIRLRREQLHAIEAYLAESPDGPRAVVGDLNSTAQWPLYRRLVRKLTDAAAVGARRKGGRPEGTWTPSPGIPPFFRIDHILVRGLEVDDFRVAPIKGSDHRVVVADVRLRSHA
jgi:endonuclease/exonuclease/phosphatase (EEP) superfamily protein YafD